MVSIFINQNIFFIYIPSIYSINELIFFFTLFTLEINVKTVDFIRIINKHS